MPDARGGMFSEALNLWFRWEDDQTTHVRLLRPSLPDGTPITTSMEEQHLRKQEQQLREQEQHLQEAAEVMAAEETVRRQEAEALAKQEVERRQELEVELERLRTQIANRENGTP